MNEAKKLEIERVARLHHKAEQRVRSMHMMNTPQDPIEREQAAVDLALAEAELWELGSELAKLKYGMESK